MKKSNADLNVLFMFCPGMVAFILIQVSNIEQTAYIETALFLCWKKLSALDKAVEDVGEPSVHIDLLVSSCFLLRSVSLFFPFVVEPSK